uniref:Diphthamide biosynthesis 2 n=1 Tax=Hucho hucho TaxID=62062 RepID=A0A4W5N5S4_9TELE
MHWAYNNLKRFITITLLSILLIFPAVAVDEVEVAVEHVGADCIVHCGVACLSPSRRDLWTWRLVPPPSELYPDRQSHVILLYDVNYAHIIGKPFSFTLTCVPRLGDFEQHNDSSSPCQNGDLVVYQFGRQFVLKYGQTVEDYSVFFIGHEGATKALMKRYYAIERAKDASVVGILVGTLGVENYLTIIEQLKETIHRAGKKSYMFAIGKLNVAKLSNFHEIDIYVLIFYKPVVTPFEMEVACNKNREWSGEYVTDLRDLFPGGCKHVALANPDDLEDGDETDVSLITGPVSSSRHSSLVLWNQTLTVANTNTAVTFLAGHSWQGLEQKLGETLVVKALEGRKGIAYEEDLTTDRDHSSLRHSSHPDN